MRRCRVKGANQRAKLSSEVIPNELHRKSTEKLPGWWVTDLEYCRTKLDMYISWAKLK